MGRNWRGLVIDIERLSAPVTADFPCGADLEYDADFLALEQAMNVKPEQQFGDTIVAATGPDWRQVASMSEALLGRTKDLRVAVSFARAAARLHGVTGYAQALELIRRLCETYWDAVFPLLDAEYGNDPAMRMNALAALAHYDSGLLDLRMAQVAKTRGVQMLVKDVEFALGVSPAPSDTPLMSEIEIGSILRDARQEDAGLLESLINAKATANALQTLLNEKVGSDQSTDLKPVRNLLNAVAKVAAAASGISESAAEAEGGAGNGSGGAAATMVLGELRSREDAVRALDRVCEYLERNEPTNPAPLFIRRAQRLMTMNFVDIIRDMVPDSMTQVETLTGINRE
jgi:type VI secretion system protein ImpA